MFSVEDFEIHPMGDRAWLIRLRPPANAEPASARYQTMLAARRLTARLQSDRPTEAGWPTEFVAGYDTVLVPFEPEVLPTQRLLEWLHAELESAVSDWPTADLAEEPITRLHRIPVRYGGDLGPDLEAVARRHNLTPEAVIGWHTGTVYRVYLLGFAPGLAYLGALPPQIDAPRLERPRPKVAAGTVALAAGLTTIYPLDSPGGWNLLGATPFPMFDPTRDPPVRFQPDDGVQFYAVQSFDNIVDPGFDP